MEIRPPGQGRKERKGLISDPIRNLPSLLSRPGTWSRHPVSPPIPGEVSPPGARFRCAGKPKGAEGRLLSLSFSLSLSLSLSISKEGEEASPMAMKAEGAESSSSSPPPLHPPLLPPRIRSRGPDPLLIVCRCFSLVTAATALLCVAVNALSAVRSFKEGNDVFDGIFRCYAIVLALFVAVAETEWGFILKFWKVLEYWVGRGMLQIFVAVMTRAFPETTNNRKDLILLQQIASYLLLACGVTYVILGLLCIGFLKRARQQKETTREQAAKDLEELERRREELEALLLAENA